MTRVTIKLRNQQRDRSSSEPTMIDECTASKARWRPDDDTRSALLSAMLADTAAIEAGLKEGITVEHFPEEGEQLLFAAILRVHSRGERVDVLTVIVELER